MKTTNRILISTAIFTLVLSLIIFTRRFFGETYHLNYLPTSPLTWDEIIDNLLEYIISAIIFSIFISYFLFKGIIEIKEKRKQEITLHGDILNKREQLKSEYNNYECRICGYRSENPPWGEDGITPSYELCDCCGAQFGKDDVSSEIINEYRQQWVSKGSKWFNKKAKPNSSFTSDKKL